MKKKSYPVLSKEYSVSKVVREKGDDIVLYNTATAALVYLNNAESEFAKRCRGDKPLEEIICELSHVLGEPPQEIEKNLSPIIEAMVDSKVLYFSPSPVHPPRSEPYEPHLFARLQSVTFEVTRKCNLSCKHCYSNSGKKRYDELTMGEIRKLIDELAPEEYRECMEQLKDKKAGKPKKELPSSDFTNCGIGMSSLTIRSDGTVAPCPPFPEEISLGNVRVDYVNDIWNNSPFLGEVRLTKAAENEKCRKCIHITVCQGGCIADTYMRTGELLCGDPYECAYFSVYNDYIPAETTGNESLSVEIR